MKLKLGIASPEPRDATSWYRAFGVFGPLCREHGIEPVPCEDWDWHKVAFCDALFLQRPFSDQHLELVTMARQMRVPVWIDYDDDLFAIDGHLPSYVTYGNQECKERIARICELASVVTVSTESIQRSMWPSAQVIPNAFNNHFCGFSDKPREKRIVWRGGVTAHADLVNVADGIKRAASEFPDWEWHFLGVPAKQVLEAIPSGRVRTHGYCELLPYLSTLYSLRPSVLIKPMDDTQFNRGKSNCCWLEATGAGAVCLAPEWDEWMRPGCGRYSPGEFQESLCLLLAESDSGRAKHVEYSRSFIRHNLTLSTVNQQRLQILEKLTNQPKGKLWVTGMTAACPTAPAK